MNKFLKYIPMGTWIPICAMLVVLAACGGGGGSTTPSSPYGNRPFPNSGQWVQYGSGTGQTGPLSNPFAIPSQSSGRTVNYVYTSPQGLGLAIGKTLTLNYSVTGPATFAPLPESNCGSGGCGTASIRLFIWGNVSDTSNDRWWCSVPATLVVGSNQSLSCKIDSSWTGTGLPGYNQATFPNSVSNPFAVGFTFGAMFAGHGVWTTSGSATFRVNSFTVN